MPLESYCPALVSEPVKPIFPCVVMSNTIHAYISQSDKGELVIGAGTDAYVSYTQRGGLHVPMHTLEAISSSSRCSACACCAIGRHRRCHTRSLADHRQARRRPTVGWGTGGFKATPGSGHLFAWTLARTAARDQRASALDRFRDGYLIDEAAAAAVAH